MLAQGNAQYSLRPVKNLMREVNAQRSLRQMKIFIHEVQLKKYTDNE